MNTAKANKQEKEKEKLSVHTRWMIRHDYAKILEIEKQSFDFPWNEGDFLHILRQDCIGKVVEYGSQIIGYMIYELYVKKFVILNFAVDPQFRLRYIGAGMVGYLTKKLSAFRRTKIAVNVRETNLAAQLFFRSQGFLANGILPKYYDENGEDAYHMEYQLPGSEEFIEE